MPTSFSFHVSPAFAGLWEPCCDPPLSFPFLRSFTLPSSPTAWVVM